MSTTRYYQAWGYVLAAYFLLEESFKLLLHIRGKGVEPGHSLSKLFCQLCDDDETLLGEYYRDFSAVADSEWDAKFPFADLYDFLVNLDGKAGDDEGSMHWRYFLIEKRDDDMPVDQHRIHARDHPGDLEHRRVCRKPDPGRGTLWRDVVHGGDTGNGFDKMSHWVEDRLNSARPPKDGLEIAWGPDYRDRYDLLLFKDGTSRCFFGEKPEKPGIPLVDVRDEVARLLQ